LDNGPEFISNALDQWAHAHGVTLHFRRPGNPVDNAFIESFNGRLRDECLDTNWFYGLEDARDIHRRLANRVVAGNRQRRATAIAAASPAARQPEAHLAARSSAAGTSAVRSARQVTREDCPSTAR